VQNENCHLSFAILEKKHEPFFNSPCQINHCPTPSAQNNMITQSNQNYFFANEDSIFKKHIKSLCLEQFEQGLSS
jgi:hypothetical protein